MEPDTWRETLGADIDTYLEGRGLTLLPREIEEIKQIAATGCLTDVVIKTFDQFHVKFHLPMRGADTPQFFPCDFFIDPDNPLGFLQILFHTGKIPGHITILLQRGVILLHIMEDLGHLLKVKRARRAFDCVHIDKENLQHVQVLRPHALRVDQTTVFLNKSLAGLDEPQESFRGDIQDLADKFQFLLLITTPLLQFAKFRDIPHGDQNLIHVSIRILNHIPG